MAARNALLGMALSVLAANAMAASPIPVVNAGGEASQADFRPSVSVAAQPAQSAGEPIILLNQLETLQREVMELRGLVEEQANIIDRIQKENRDRYLDLDRRISLMASGASATGNSVAAEVPLLDSGDRSDVSSGERGVSGKVGPGVDAAVVDKAGEALYQDTFQLIRDRKFSEAIAGLNTYLTTFPAGPYVDNAQYWLGEVHLAQGDLKEAKADFSLLLTKYPFSDKLADATYKLGQVYDRLGERDKARQYLQRAIKDFPGSSAARLADVYLRSLDG